LSYGFWAFFYPLLLRLLHPALLLIRSRLVLPLVWPLLLLLLLLLPYLVLLLA